jgi:nucleoside 2-deoxyribosyltransferase
MPASIEDQQKAKTRQQDKDPEIPTRRDQSAALVTIVAVFYALVLGQCLIQQPSIFLHPGANKTAALAMGVVFVGAAWEFLTYSLNMGRFPYKVRWVTASNTATEELRFGVDLLVATTYALLLIQAYGLSLNPSLNLFWFFGTLVVIDLLSLGGVLFGMVQWHIPRYRVFAELPFTLGLLAWYDLDRHTRSAALNQDFLTYAIGFILLRELCVRFAAKQHFASSRGVETVGQQLRRRLTRPGQPSPPTTPGVPVYLAGPLGFFPYGSDFYDRTLIPTLHDAGFGVLTPWELPDHLAAVYRHAATEVPDRLANANRETGAHNVQLIDAARAVVAVLDGTDVDSGTAAEIGYAAGKQHPIPVIGLRLDTRPSGDNRGATVNLQVEYFIELSGGIIIKAASTEPGGVSVALAELIAALRAKVPAPVAPEAMA